LFFLVEGVGEWGYVAGEGVAAAIAEVAEPDAEVDK